MKIEKPTRCNN